MKHIGRLVPILAGAVTATGAWGILAAGCGGGGSPSLQDSGPGDATMDALGDALVGQDAEPSSDASEGGDAGASNADADAASRSDGDAGTLPDADASSGDSSASVTAESFPGHVAAALCTTIANCCGTSGDAATFNWQSCYNSQLATGWVGSNTGTNLVDGGHVTFDAAQAQTCLNTIAAADCTSNQFTSVEATQLLQSCYAAYAGRVTAGSACAGSIECAPGNYCLPVDGGVGDAGAIGLCQALAGVGGACGGFGVQSLGHTVCSYRGSASDGLYCQNISGDAGITQLPAADWTCEQQQATGSECYSDKDCTSRICHQVGTNVFQCSSAGNWANASTCARYAVAVDAGGGG